MKNAKENISFSDRVYLKIKQLLQSLTYSRELFADDIWQIRFSNKHQQNLKYSVERKMFTLALKSTDDIYKYLQMVMMALMLVLMVYMSQHIGISTREMEQNNYTELLYNHFHHMGDYDAYKAHPFASTQAQYVDLIIYSVGKTLKVDDIFLLKHLVSAVFGWLLVLYLSILVLRAFSWRASFFTAFFLLISPRFLGYSLCNVVDVTFAFAFIFTITQMYYFSRELPVIRVFRLVKILLGTLVALSTYNAGFVLVHFFVVFTLLNFLLYNPLKKFYQREYLTQLGILCIIIVAYTITVNVVHACATFFLTKSLILPSHALVTMINNYPYAQNQLFEGHIIGPDNFPKQYFTKYLFITTPTIVLICFLLFFVFFKSAVKSLRVYSIFIFLYPFFYCIHKVKFHYMNADTMWGIYYSIYPLFMLIVVSGLECTLRSINDKYTNFVVLCILSLLSFFPIRHVAFNQPLTSLYFNEISGGIHNAYAKYELDVNEDANKKACQWMKRYIYKNEVGRHANQEHYIVGSNCNVACNVFFKKDTNITIVQMPYNAADTTWDFYISFCNDIPSAKLRNGTWPGDSTLHRMTIENKTIVAYYENAYRKSMRLLRDSIAKAKVDSILLLQDSLHAN